MDNLPEHLILFDGVCHLCNGSIQVIIKNDSKKIFRFASLQSETAKKILPIESAYLKSIVYIHKGNIYYKSEAVLKIALELKFPLILFAGLLFIPFPIRDLVYDFVAKKRYDWFGKKEQCMIPSEEQKKLFIDF